MPPRKLEQSRRLLVEGGDSYHFFIRVLALLEIEDVDVEDFGGVNDLTAFLAAFVQRSDFIGGNITSVGIIRDAESDAGSAFQSVCSSLAAAGLPVPSEPVTRAIGSPHVSVFILPDNTSSGMLETLLLQSVAEDPTLACIADFLNCVEQRTGQVPSNRAKATAYAFLASRRNPALRLGQALDTGYWLWASPAFDSVRQFLQVL